MGAHYFNFTPTTGAEYAFAIVFQAGWVGVDLFFVLSGFLITGILLDTRGSEGYFRTFYSRRVLRIFPLYYVMLAFVILVLPVIAPSHGPQVEPVRETFWWHALYGVNWIVAAKGHWVPLTAMFWSLAIEEQFYLVWPALVAWVPRAALPRVALGVAVLAFILRVIAHWLGVNPGVVFAATPMRLDALMAGALVAMAMRSPRWATWLVRWRPALGWGAVGVLLMVGGADHGWWGIGATMQTFGYSALAVLSAVAVSYAATPSRFARELSTPWLRAIGTVAYGLYLLHPWALELVKHIIGTPDSLARLVGVAALAFIVANGMAWVSWLGFERPILSLKQFVPYARPVAAPMATEPAA